MITKDDLQKIIDALDLAYEHLEYCGWGDAWERECATHNKFPQQIEEALKIGKSILEANQ